MGRGEDHKNTQEFLLSTQQHHVADHAAPRGAKNGYFWKLLRLVEGGLGKELASMHNKAVYRSRKGVQLSMCQPRNRFSLLKYTFYCSIGRFVWQGRVARLVCVQFNEYTHNTHTTHTHARTTHLTYLMRGAVYGLLETFAPLWLLGCCCCCCVL